MQASARREAVRSFSLPCLPVDLSVEALEQLLLQGEHLPPFPSRGPSRRGGGYHEPGGASSPRSPTRRTPRRCAAGRGGRSRCPRATGPSFCPLFPGKREHVGGPRSSRGISR